jgi:hypothetical protein
VNFSDSFSVHFSYCGEMHKFLGVLKYAIAALKGECGLKFIVV